MRALMWFRSDLRLADNPALSEAARRADRGALAVFTVCPDQWARHDLAPVKADFILRNLYELSTRLAGANIALKILHTPTFKGVPDALLALANQHDCDELFFNREHEPNELDRDAAVTDAFKKSGRRVHTFEDQCVIPPGELRTGDDRVYKVYTPFKKAWYAAWHDNPDITNPLDPPKRQPEMVSAADPVPTLIKGFDDFSQPLDAIRNLWPESEAAAHGKLSLFLAHHLRTYKTDRDAPALDATSSLSPYLAAGVVSSRQLLHAAIHANDGRLDTGSPGAVCWISELLWREFYRHILVGFPRVARNRAFQPDTESLTWHDNDAHFDAWRHARTGYPIVDAGMRQLHATGWMHNRVRMIVAMFLTKNLFLDWRHGERHFMRHLIDGDLASNNGGWQWSASTGTDAAPYFRVFNPISQSQKCDPEGDYIRRYVPELADVDTKDIHDPSALPGLLRAKLDYPDPIVDHKQTRAHAIAAFKALRG